MPLEIANSLVPFFHISIDNSEANPLGLIQGLNTLMVGQQLATATVAEKTIQRVRSPDEARKLFGAGSHLHNMSIVWFKNNTQTELSAFAFDDTAGNAATGTMTIVGTATEDGQIIVYVAGKRLVIPVLIGDDATAIASSIVGAVTADSTLSVTAANVAGVVTITSRHVGIIGNQTIIKGGHFEGEEVLPAGVTSNTVVAMSGGTGAPDIDDVFTSIGDELFRLFLHPYNDSISIGKWDVQLAARNAASVKSDGYAITCLSDTVSNIDSAVSAYNSQFNVIVADVGGVTDSFMLAASVCAQVAKEGSIDPARPFQTLLLAGTIAANKTGRTIALEQQQLLVAGAATITVNGAGTNQISRIVTTYKTNEFGSDDISYKDLNTLLALSTYRSSFDALMAGKYPRHKLADDGVRALQTAGQAIITPKVAKAEALAHFISMEELGIVEGFDQFKASIEVTRNATDPNRLDFLLKPDLVNQFRVAGVEIKFIL